MAPVRMRVLLTSILVMTVCLTGCSESIDPNEPQGFIQTKGSDTIVNAVQQTAEEFMKRYPHVFIAITGGGSGVGIASLINRTTEIATASREMKAKEIQMAEARGVHPYEIVVAFDGVAVIVNHNNPVDRLTIDDLHRIYTGKARNWKEFGGKDLGIVTLSREVSSGTHMYFKEEVIQLGKKGNVEEFSHGTLLLTSSQAIVEEVAGNEGAIGYLGMGYLSDRTKTVSVSRMSNLESRASDASSLRDTNDEIRGTAQGFWPPTVENVQKNAYPLSRPLFLYTDGQPQGITKLFVDFALGPVGQKQFMDTGFVPVGETLAKED